MSAGAISGAAGGTATGSIGRFAELSSEEFIKVMLQELSNQDPFQPQDSGALLEQLSSLRNIESQLSLQKQLGSLVLQNQISSASGMIGRQVEGLDEANRTVQGGVTSIRVEKGQVLLDLDSGAELSLDRVTHITSGTGD